MKKLHEMRDRKAAANALMTYFGSVWQATTERTRSSEASGRHHIPSCPATNAAREVTTLPTTRSGLNLLATLAVDTPWKRLAHLTMGVVPWRHEDVRDLTFDNVHFAEGYVHIREPKYGKPRAFDYPMTRRLRELLEEALQLRSFTHPWAFWPPRTETGQVNLAVPGCGTRIAAGMRGGTSPPALLGRVSSTANGS